MSDLSGPTGPEDPYGKIRVNEVQKDASEEDLSKRVPLSQKKSMSVIKLVHVLQKFVSLFQRKSEKQSSRTHEMITTDLAHLVQTLDELKLEDLSGDIEFMIRLSTAWHQFLRDLKKYKGFPEIYTEMIYFKTLIDDYTGTQDYSLSYYLDEFAGKGWIPFPCVDILKSLYAEHHQNPTHSHLKKWTTSIQKIIHHISTMP